MKLSDYLNEQTVEVQSTISSARAVLERLVTLVEAPCVFMDPARLLEEISEREKLGSTGIGEGVAIPHVHLEHVDAMHVAMLTAEEGIDFAAIDDKPCRIFIIVVAPDDDREGYLRLLSEVSRLLRRESARESLLGAKSAVEFLAALREAENS